MTTASPDPSVAPGALGAWEEATGPAHSTAASQQLPWGITGGQPPSPGCPEHSCYPLNPLLPLACLSEWQTDTAGPMAGGWPNTNFSCKDKQLLQEQLAGPREQHDEEQCPPAGCNSPQKAEHQLAPLHTATHHCATSLVLPQPHEHSRCCQGHFPPSYTVELKCRTF